jgi:uncharacterized RDD family membrane protein YckC
MEAPLSSRQKSVDNLDLPVKSTSPERRPEILPAPRPYSQEELPIAGSLRLEKPTVNWRKELSARVVRFRKRRGGAQLDTDPPENLDLDFENSGEPQGVHPFVDALEIPRDRDSGFDLEVSEPAIVYGDGDPPRELLSFEESADDVMHLDGTPKEEEEMSLGEPLAKSPPMEILVRLPTGAAPEEPTEGLFVAPLGRRFLAGLTDALVLVVGAALFGTIFWFWCGRLSPAPFNLSILGLVAVILIFSYFAAFTAMASATPGMLWMECEIRNLDGDPPTLRESLWRAFGVLVSLSALMLGFMWACVDSDALTWHDRMSGTVITPVASALGVVSEEAQT